MFTTALITLAIQAAITAALGLLVSLFASSITDVAFNIATEILTGASFSFKINDILAIIPNIGIDLMGFFKVIGYVLLFICTISSVLKAMASPITGSQAKSPAQYVTNSIMTLIIMILVFGVGQYEGLINWFGDILNDNLFLASADGFKTVLAQRNIEFGDSWVNASDGGAIMQLVIVCALCSGVITAAVTYVERYLSLALYILMGPVCFGFSASDETKGIALEWVKTLFAQMLTIAITLLIWRMFYYQVQQKWTLASIGIILAELGLIKNSEKIVNALGLRTIATGDAARALGDGARKANMMAHEIGNAARGIANAGIDSAKQYNAAKNDYVNSRANAKSDRDIDMAKKKFNQSTGLGQFSEKYANSQRANANADKKWQDYKEKAGLGKGVGEYGISQRKANEAKAAMNQNIAGKMRNNGEGFNNWKQHQDDLKFNQEQAQKAQSILNGEGKYGNLSEQARKTEAGKALSAQRDVTPLTEAGKSFDSQLKAASGVEQNKFDEQLRGLGAGLYDSEMESRKNTANANTDLANNLQQAMPNMSDSSREKLDALKSEAPISNDLMSSLDSVVGGENTARLASVDNRTRESIGSARSLDEVNARFAERDAQYATVGGRIGSDDTEFKASTLAFNNDEMDKADAKVYDLYQKELGEAHGDPNLIDQAYQKYSDALTNIHGAVPENYPEKLDTATFDTKHGFTANDLDYSKPEFYSAIEKANTVFDTGYGTISKDDMNNLFSNEADDRYQFIGNGVAAEIDNGNDMEKVLLAPVRRSDGSQFIMAIIDDDIRLAMTDDSNKVFTCDENLQFDMHLDTKNNTRINGNGWTGYAIKPDDDIAFGDTANLFEKIYSGEETGYNLFEGLTEGLDLDRSKEIEEYYKNGGK